MRVTLSRCDIAGKVCPECNLSAMQVYYVNIELDGYGLMPLSICAACLSALGASIQHQARIVNRAPV